MNIIIIVHVVNITQNCRRTESELVKKNKKKKSNVVPERKDLRK